MTKQLFYEDVSEGMEMSLSKQPTTRQLVMWAGASADLYELHYDKDFARSTGVPDVLIHGRLKAALLGQLMTDWIGEQGSLRKLTCNYRGMDFPGQELLCKGKVIKKYIKDGEHFVECEVWTENPRGEKTTPGTAVVVLPSRSG